MQPSQNKVNLFDLIISYKLAYKSSHCGKQVKPKVLGLFTAVSYHENLCTL